ncbi:MAG TPA: ADOP family duplicated permease [Vicinamibacteria bacterium]|nr:ADOP family duplicated permease [Vicinamibacteria bacterium]
MIQRALDTLLIDMRDAARRLRSKLVFAAVAVALLAVTIAASTVLFGIAHQVLLRPLPYEGAGALVKLVPVRPGAPDVTDTFSEGEYIELDRRSTIFTGLAAYYPSRSVSISDGGPAVQVQATRATASLFETLGAKPILGRVFDAEEESPKGSLAVILSHSFWLERYGGDPAVVGRTIIVDGLVHVVVGVARESFRFPDADTRFWLALRLDRADVNYHSGQYLGLVARMAADVTGDKARDELRRVSTQLTEEGLTRYRGTQVRMVDLRTDLVGDTRDAILILIGVAVLVLSAVCFNLGSFVLSQVMVRRSELAVRAALGAGAGRLIGSVVTEVEILVGIGALSGVLLASECLRFLRLARPAFLPRVEELALDASWLVIATGIALIAAFFFGAGPAVLAHRMGSHDALRVRGPEASSPSSSRARSFLVTVQLAASVVLLVGGGLLLGSLLRLGRVDPGFKTENVVTFRISLPDATYPTDARARAFFREALSRIRSLPGMEAAGATTILPMSGLRSYGFAWREEEIGRPEVVPQGFEMRWVTPGVFDTLGIPLTAGRRFDGRDSPDAPFSAILSRSLARALWPSENAIGKRFKLGRLVDSSTPWMTVVGVVGDLRQTTPRLAAVPTAYFALGQLYTPRQMSFVVRTPLPLAAAADSIRSAVLSIDPDRPVYAVRFMADLVESSVSLLRVSATLVTGFAALVVFITLVGLYALVNYMARLRAHEFTLRMILGASPGSIIRSLLHECAVLCGTGITLGLAASLVLSRFAESLLFGLSAWDEVTFAGAAAVVALTSLLASIVPAKRAAIMDPSLLFRA